MVSGAILNHRSLSFQDKRTHNSTENEIVNPWSLNFSIFRSFSYLVGPFIFFQAIHLFLRDSPVRPFIIVAFMAYVRVVSYLTIFGLYLSIESFGLLLRQAQNKGLCQCHMAWTDPLHLSTRSFLFATPCATHTIWYLYPRLILPPWDGQWRWRLLVISLSNFVCRSSMGGTAPVFLVCSPFSFFPFSILWRQRARVHVGSRCRSIEPINGNCLRWMTLVFCVFLSWMLWRTSLRHSSQTNLLYDVALSNMTCNGH